MVDGVMSLFGGDGGGNFGGSVSGNFGGATINKKTNVKGLNTLSYKPLSLVAGERTNRTKNYNNDGFFSLALISAILIGGNTAITTTEIYESKVKKQKKAIDMIKMIGEIFDRYDKPIKKYPYKKKIELLNQKIRYNKLKPYLNNTSKLEESMKSLKISNYRNFFTVLFYFLYGYLDENERNNPIVNKVKKYFPDTNTEIQDDNYWFFPGKQKTFEKKIKNVKNKIKRLNIKYKKNITINDIYKIIDPYDYYDKNMRHINNIIKSIINDIKLINTSINKI